MCVMKPKNSSKIVRYGMIKDFSYIDFTGDTKYSSELSLYPDYKRNKKVFSVFIKLGNGSYDDPQQSRDSDPTSKSGWGGLAFYILDANGDTVEVGAVLKAFRDQRNQKERHYKFISYKTDEKIIASDYSIFSCQDSNSRF